MRQTHYIVQTAAAKMPQSAMGVYRRVAVLEVDAGLTSVSMISTRAKGCHRVVQLWDRCNVGSTERCAYQRALVEADALVEQLNAASRHIAVIVAEGLFALRASVHATTDAAHAMAADRARVAFHAAAHRARRDRLVI